MTPAEERSLKGKPVYVAKPWNIGRKNYWRAYDQTLGSYPVQRKNVKFPHTFPDEKTCLAWIQENLT